MLGKTEKKIHDPNYYIRYVIDKSKLLSMHQSVINMLICPKTPSMIHFSIIVPQL